MSRLLLFLTCIAGLCLLSRAQLCSDFVTCYECLYQPQGCGWCGLTGRCVPGNTTGPFEAGECTNLETWEFTTSRVLNTTTGTGAMTPVMYNVFLRPGIPLEVPVTITVPSVPPLDFFLLVDSSVSMSDDVTSIRTQISSIIAGLQQFQPDTSIGLGSFIEKPVMPFCGYPECYVYQLHASLTNDTGIVNGALTSLLGSLRRNFEHPEASLDALVIAAQDQNIGFRQGSYKVVMVVTDTESHQYPQGLELCGIQTENNLDGVMDGFPPGSGEDYPSVLGVRQALIRSDVSPIFAAVDIVTPFWRNVTETIGFGSYVAISSDSANIVQAIVNGTRDVLQRAVLAEDLDDDNVIAKINPQSFTGVQGGNSVTFNVTLYVDPNSEVIGSATYATARYVGFGNIVTFNVQTAIQCKGCNPFDPTSKLDVCGVCAGNGSSCLGCDGVPYSGVIPDFCGICGGDNSTCRGCDGTVNGPQYDQCGICGGDGTACLGCDGVAFSGLVVNDCGECGGDPNCKAIQGVIAGLTALAVIGVVVAVGALAFMLAAGKTIMAADALLFQQLAQIKENPLYKESNTVRSNPLYKGY